MIPAMSDTQASPDTRPDWLSDAPSWVTEESFTDALMQMVRENDTDEPPEPIESMPGWDDA
jgi:hypothetical protein